MSSMKAQQETSVFNGANSAYLEAQYEQYLKDPNAIDESWRDYFARLPMVNGNARDIPHSEVREHFYQITRNGGARPTAASGGSASSQDLKQIYVSQLIS